MTSFDDISTVLLEKRNFKKTISTIDILYIIGNDFSPWLKIWDHYPKIRPCLARINCESFDNLSRNACFEIRPLSSRTKGTIMMRGSSGTSWDQEQPPQLAGDGGSTPSSLGHFTRLTHWQWPRFTANRAGFNLFGLLWFSLADACSKRTFLCRRSWLAVSFLWGEREIR